MTQRISKGLGGGKPSLSATSSIINPTQTGLGSNAGFLIDRTVTKRLRLSTVSNMLLEAGSLIMKLLVVAGQPSGKLLQWVSVKQPDTSRLTPHAVELALFSVKHDTMNAYGRMEVQFHIFLMSALHGGELYVLAPLSKRKRASWTSWIGSWVVLQRRSSFAGRKENLCFLPILKRDFSIVRSLAYEHNG